MKCAIIGCGRIALNHVYALQANKLELTALCDSNPSQMDTLLKRAQWEGSCPAFYADYHDLLSQHPDIELISIATESGSHARIALDCIDAGRHLIIEKPLALSMADAREIIARAKAKQVRVSACHQNRFNAAVQHARTVVEAGYLGAMSHASVHIRWARDRAYYDQAPWRGTWAEDGGCLMNQCIHGIDLLRWMMQSPVVSVYAQTRQRFHDYLEAEDVGVGVLTFANGAVGTVEGTVNVYPKNLEESLYLFGKEGTIKIGGKSTNEIEVWDFDCERLGIENLAGFKEPAANVYGHGHTALFGDVAQAIREGRESYVDATSGKDALEVVLAMYTSQKTGQPVQLPLKDFASTDMTGEF